MSYGLLVAYPVAASAMNAIVAGVTSVHASVLPSWASKNALRSAA